MLVSKLVQGGHPWPMLLCNPRCTGASLARNPRAIRPRRSALAKGSVLFSREPVPLFFLRCPRHSQLVHKSSKVPANLPREGFSKV